MICGAVLFLAIKASSSIIELHWKFLFAHLNVTDYLNSWLSTILTIVLCFALTYFISKRIGKKLSENPGSLRRIALQLIIALFLIWILNFSFEWLITFYSWPELNSTRNAGFDTDSAKLIYYMVARPYLETAETIFILVGIGIKK